MAMWCTPMINMYKCTNRSIYSVISLKCCSQRKNYADDELIIYQNGKWIKALTSVCTGWAFSKTAKIFSPKTGITFVILTVFYNLQCGIIEWKDREDLQMSHKGIVYYSCTFTTKYLRKEASPAKLPGWLCYSLQGHFLHPYLFVSAGMTGAMEQKCWHLVSTNEKWQMHKSFRLCRVEISVWHSLRLLHWWKLPRKPTDSSCHRWCAKKVSVIVQASNLHHNNSRDDVICQYEQL